MTIYLALSLTAVLSLCVLLIEGARMNGARFMAEYSLDVGMNSVLAEYHKELLEQYDVFFVDTSYGTDLPSIYNTAEHLQKYINAYNYQYFIERKINTNVHFKSLVI